jgi:hypothetical protein
MGDTTCPILLCYGDSLTHPKIGFASIETSSSDLRQSTLGSQCGTEIHQFSYSIGGTIGAAHGPSKDVGEIHSVQQAITSGTDITEL